jgi:hypothetical protein
MAQRRRNSRRNALIFLGSFLAHIGVLFMLASNFRFYPPPQETEAVQVELIPQEELPPPPPPPPIPKIVQQKPQPQPTPQPPQPQPQPTPPTPQPAAPQPAPAPTAPVKSTPAPTPVPVPKPAPIPSPLAPPTPAPQPGPPKSVSVNNVIQSQPNVVNNKRMILHKAPGAANVPSVSIPGAIFAPSASAGPPNSAPSGGAPPGGGSGSSGALLGGALPGFGSGLRGGPLGCANADALNLSPEEKAKCAQAFGEGTRDAPAMNAIDASKRTVIDQQAAQQAATEKYRDSTPAGSEATPVAGQPKVESTLGGGQ